MKIDEMLYKGGGGGGGGGIRFFKNGCNEEDGNYLLEIG